MGGEGRGGVAGRGGVGEFPSDISAANAAGTTSILLATGEAPEFAKDADVVIKTLAQLPAVLGI